MIDTIGKVYESIVRNRLELAIQKAGKLSERQYGFIKKKSTNVVAKDEKVAQKLGT